MKTTINTIILACLSIIIFTTQGMAQNVPITFEPGGNGHAWTWTTFENGANVAPQMVANPNTSGINTSATVASITAMQVGQPWAGFESLHPGSTPPGTSQLGTFTLDATNSTVKIMVYKSVISDVGIKFATASNASTGEIKVANTLINQWEELTFDFSSKIGEPSSTGIDQIIIFPDFQLSPTRTSDNVCYFDNITFSASTAPPTAPTVAAPTPTVPAANVISLFSNAYTNVGVDTWLTGWSAGSLTDLQIAGNDTKRYGSLNFVGIEFTGANLINATSMTHFHLDAWTPNLTTFKIKLVDFGANAAFGGGDDVEHELTFTPTIGGWNSYDIPLSDFTGLITRAHLAQLILVGAPTGTGTVFVDNVYFRSPVVNTFNVPITFEPGGNGHAWTWTTFENGANVAPQMVANPNTSGINTSATVASITAMQVGQPWAGFESLHPGSTPPGTSQLGTFTLDATNSTVKMMVYKSVISDVGIKFATASNASTGEIKVANTLINQWEELTFDFSSKIGEPSSTGIDQIIIFPDFQLSPTRTSDNVCYFDNITFSASTAPPTTPSVAAPTPTVPAANVISLFSNAYTNVGVDTWLTGWSAGSLTDLQIAGNDTKKYSSLNFVGVEFTGANMVNANSMTHFHVDAWTPNLTTFKIKLVDFGANGAFGGGDDVEHELTFTPTIGGWNSYNIPLSDFTGLVTKGHLAQLIFVGAPTGTGIVFIDNVYFYTNATAGPTPAPTPTRPAANVISLYSDAYTNVGVDTWLTGWSAGNLADIQISGNNTKLYSNVNFVGIEFTGANMIDASSMYYFHLDAWTPNMTTFRIKLVDFGANGAFGGGDDVEHELSFTPVQNGWNSYEIPLSNFTGLTTKAHLAQLILSGNPAGAGTVYVDNVYFHNFTNVPLVAAPTPTALPANVISMFSNAYTNVPVDTWRTGWSNATLADVMVAGNDTKLYTLLDFVGIETVGPNLIDATAMTTFNVDIWTPNMTTFRIKLVDFGANGVFQGGDDVEHELSFTPTLTGWNSYHIPLSNFTGLTTKAHIAQLIFSGNPAGAGTVFVDNVYFSQPPLTTTLSLNCFIEGYWDGVSAMVPVLANQGQANPTTDCDSITVELHATSAPYATLYSTAAVLKTNGTATCNFSPAVTQGNYYVVVKHRNAIQTWSATPVSIGTTGSYNFTTAQTQAYGSASQKEVSTGVWAMYSGDVVADENMDLLDLASVETDASAFAFGYYATDLTGDGNVDLLDTPIVELNAGAFIFSQHP